MIIGIPKEIKNNENRVALTPSGAQELTKRGHKVYVQASAGVNSGFADDAYTAVGAEMLPTIEDVYARAEMIIKVKEPIAPEYQLIRKDQLVFTFFHFASSEPLTRAMIDSGAVCCAYETVERADRSLPLLIPMSEVAGRMATQEGRYFLEKPRGGKGILLGGVPGVKPAKVFVIGAGVVGTAAARTAAGTGADVTICDISLQRLTYLADVMPKNVKTLMSSEYNIREELKRADLVVGSVLIPGAKAPKLVTRDMLKEMEPGTVMVDVAIDQGGCFETSRPTTHEDPVYYVDGILHYCVANIPGAVPYTSTLALTNATLPYAIQLADKGWRRACRENRELELGLNIVQGKVVYKPVADAWGTRLRAADAVVSAVRFLQRDFCRVTSAAGFSPCTYSLQRSRRIRPSRMPSARRRSARRTEFTVPAIRRGVAQRRSCGGPIRTAVCSFIRSRIRRSLCFSVFMRIFER